MVEGTRLESVRTLKRTAGSNPALSAIERRAVPFGAARFCFWSVVAGGDERNEPLVISSTRHSAISLISSQFCLLFI